MSLHFSFKPTLPKIDESHNYDFISLGGGPASINAALYAKRKGLKTLLIAKNLGGNLLNTDQVENYLGFKLETGENLAKAFEAHLKELSVDMMLNLAVTHIEKREGLFEITLEDGRIFKAKTSLLALGSNPRKLNVVGEDKFQNAGVAYCAICDAPLYKNKKVVIAGGGNSAVSAAIDVAKVASQVVLVHRSEFRADDILIKRLETLDNVEIKLQTQIMELSGSNKLEHIKVFDKNTKTEDIIACDGIFIEIGHIANTAFLNNLVELNDHGEIIVDELQKTSLEGLYAAGDVTNAPYKQIILAVADGAKAALSASQYLQSH